MDTIFSGKWILQEAYSSDPIDQYALTRSKSSWAEFTKVPNGTITLHMAHMLTVPNRTVWCVYHHFPNIKLRKNVLLLDLPQFNASAKIKFLKACNECLVLTAKAFVPGYEPLDYLLAYGLHPELNEYFLRPTREQASCKRLKPPPPFHYKGAAQSLNSHMKRDEASSEGLLQQMCFTQEFSGFRACAQAET
ncbi:hypothetical protein N1851_033172 [Merluccius polli]|uniref:Uncharacterized protein n=1 Tax=Merluccius polli TaxID=89951 RepID=A0AA47M1T4_MERPO|nr:hypothetical protein N1851_033172 [Merluccius polli]